MKPRTVPLFAAMFAVAACDTQQEQDVIIVMQRDDAPAAAVEVRLHESLDCAGTHRQQVTSKDGRTQFARTVEIGGFGVITDELSVCVEIDGLWKPVFSSLHGPAPARIDIQCNLHKPDQTCAIRFDGRLQADFQHESDDA